MVHVERFAKPQPALYRMSFWAAHSVKEWAIVIRQSCDKTTVETATLLAALLRNVTTDITVWPGRTHATVSTDWQDFVGTLDIKQLIVESAAHTTSCS